MQAGSGARFETADGGRWIDFGSMTWNANLGHGHPRMTAALAEAARRGLLTYTTAVFPDKARAVYTDFVVRGQKLVTNLRRA